MSHRTQNNFSSSGIFSLAIETNLGLEGNGLYGYDSVALSYLGSGLPSISHQVVARIATDDFWMGLFGLVSNSQSNLSLIPFDFICSTPRFACEASLFGVEARLGTHEASLWTQALSHPF